MGCRIVCISRSLGAGGEEVAHLVAKSLGFRLVDDEILARAAEKAKEEETTAPQTAVPAETPPAAKDEKKAATPEAGPHPSATGRVRSRIHSLHDPAYNLASPNPAYAIASTSCAAVTPDPQ